MKIAFTFLGVFSIFLITLIMLSAYRAGTYDDNGYCAEWGDLRITYYQKIGDIIVPIETRECLRRNP